MHVGCMVNRLCVLGFVFLLTACTTTQLPTEEPIGIQLYYMGFLIQSPDRRSIPDSLAQAAGHGHMENIGRLLETGQLMLAGPFDDSEAPFGQTLAGIFILQAENKPEAEALLATDPAVQAGLFSFEVVPWYGPSGITFTGRPPVRR